MENLQTLDDWFNQITNEAPNKTLPIKNITVKKDLNQDEINDFLKTDNEYEEIEDL